MQTEANYRLALLGLLLLTAPIAGYHRLRAHRVGGKVSRRDEGLLRMVALRACAVLGGGGMWLYLIHPPAMEWAALPLPEPLRWTGALAGLLGIPLVAWVFHSLGNNVTDTVAVRRESTLVQHGPYRWVRHPMYLTFALYFLAMSLLTANAFVAVMAIAALGLLALRTPLEEAKLLEHHGERYRAYVARTGRYLPRWQNAAAALGVFTLVATGSAAEPAPDKSQYNLFNPTPPQWLREMSTDRPDKTESPYTVDAGHFQIEMDLANYSYDKHNPARDGTIVRTWSVAPVNLKVGLLNTLDFQLVLQPHTYIHTSDPAAGVSKQRGFGDLVTRMKWNLWGNDGGETAFALMPYLKLPTNQDQLGNRSVEGGLIAPLAVELPAGWSMGLMTQLDIVRDTSSSGYHPEFVNTVTFSHDIIGDLGGYVEFFSSVSTERGSSWVGTVDLGLTYALTKNIQLDAGINLGVTRAADDWNPFIGLSWRF